MCTQGNKIAVNDDYLAGKYDGQRDYLHGYSMDDDTRVSLGCSAEYLAGYDYAQYVESRKEDEFRLTAS